MGNVELAEESALRDISELVADLKTATHTPRGTDPCEELSRRTWAPYGGLGNA